MKPVNCPGHIQILQRLAPKWSDLPLKLAEFGVCHRNEPTSALHGLFRLAQFTQDDGHLFCLEGQVVPEVARFARSLLAFYAEAGFPEVKVALATRPEHRFGTDDLGDRAERRLAEAAREAGLPWAEHPGEGAFYGPKLEFTLQDRQGRGWQCGTIQLDFVLPDRFALQCKGPEGHPIRPVMLHRALLGSLERFLSILLEQHQGLFSKWGCGRAGCGASARPVICASPGFWPWAIRRRQGIPGRSSPCGENACGWPLTMRWPGCWSRAADPRWIDGCPPPKKCHSAC